MKHHTTRICTKGGQFIKLNLECKIIFNLYYFLHQSQSKSIHCRHLMLLILYFTHVLHYTILVISNSLEFQNNIVFMYYRSVNIPL